MTNHSAHKIRGPADADAAASRLVLAQLSEDGDVWIQTWNELGDCPQCIHHVAQQLAAKAAQALTCIPDHEHDDCALCDRPSDPDAKAADDLARYLAALLDFIAKRGDA